MDYSDEEENEFTPIFVIQQYLYENGYETTLSQFEQET
jgi:hypothetical protein